MTRTSTRAPLTRPGDHPGDAVSDAVLVEDGSLPRLDAVIEEYGKRSEQEKAEEVLAVWATAKAIEE
ncbi:hypothetical protein [Sinorhizobium meliloti]|uniref:hypothetical protein n=1 Tax=Rhizobium meliloti TaxID=382 RepID=UPI0012FE20D4|nr:hypothetical protein [Sinorhizobium meliloti]